MKFGRSRGDTPCRLVWVSNFASTSRTRAAFRRREDSAMRILVMGDFSGRGDRGVAAAADLASRPIVPVDVDSFDQALSRFAPRAPPVNLRPA
jgi:hypothetical protein